jgi:membrane protein involved in colicin uptake
MLRRLIFTILLLLAGYVGFMYFFGKGEDRTNAEAIVHDSKEVVKSIGLFLKNQKEKYDEGEFDRLIKRVDNSIERLKEAAPEKREEVRQTLQDLQRELKQLDPTKLTEADRLRLDKLQRDIEDALRIE